MYGILLAAALAGSTAAPDQHYGWGGGHASAFYGTPGVAGGVGYGGCAYGAGAGGGYGYGGLGYVDCGAYGPISGWDTMNCDRFGGHSTYACIGFVGCAAGPGGPRTPPEILPFPRPDRGSAPANQGNATRARVTVTLPARAKLYVDGRPVQVSSSTRTFTTPRLDSDRTYYYEVRAEVLRDGVPYTEKKRVLVRAGADVRVSFATLPLDPVPAPAPEVAAAEMRPRH